jgi:hypothetical protein
MSLFFRLFFWGETVENFPFFSKNNSPNFALGRGGGVARSLSTDYSFNGTVQKCSQLM